MSFLTVVSAEYTQEEQANIIPNGNFSKMLTHVCDKFQNHLVHLMKDTDDPYFMDVERLTYLGDFERIHGRMHGGVKPATASIQEDISNSKVLELSDKKVNISSVVTIMVEDYIFGVGICLGQVRAV